MAYAFAGASLSPETSPLATRLVSSSLSSSSERSPRCHLQAATAPRCNYSRGRCNSSGSLDSCDQRQRRGASHRLQRQKICSQAVLSTFLRRSTHPNFCNAAVDSHSTTAAAVAAATVGLSRDSVFTGPPTRLEKNQSRGWSIVFDAQRQSRLKAKDDDFEGDMEFMMDTSEIEEDEDEDYRDYETEYESPTGFDQVQNEADSFINTEEKVEETVVDWKIDEDEFHKLKLLTCDFFIRKVPDPDDDVYDFREMYVTPTDTDTYSIPKIKGSLPKKPIRCTWSNYEYIHSIEPPVDVPRAPLAETKLEVMKIFLMRHLKDRRGEQANFVLDFEEIYVIDNKTKSLTRAEVKVDVPGGRRRDRSKETLIVRDDGTSFRIIPRGSEKTPDEVIQEVQWDKTRADMEEYLRGFRDYEISNWF